MYLPKVFQVFGRSTKWIEVEKIYSENLRGGLRRRNIAKINKQLGESAKVHLKNSVYITLTSASMCPH
jgi:hypothetical protein